MNEKEVRIVTLNSFSKRLKKEMGEIPLETPIKELVQNNMYILSHILLDIHENLELDTLAYPINQEAQLFPTVQSVIDHLMTR